MKTTPPELKRCLYPLFSLALLCVWPCANVSAASATWTGAVDGTFLTGSNWSGDVAPGNVSTGTVNNADVATFNTNVNTAITIDTGRTIGNLVFGNGAGAYTFGGADLWFTNGGGSSLGGRITIDAGVTSAQVFNSNINLAFNASFPAWSLISNGSGAMTINGNLLDQYGGSTVTQTVAIGGDGSGVNTVNGIIADKDATHRLGVTKTGLGAWTLTAANAYTGPTTVANGVLNLDFSAATTGSNIVNSSSPLQVGVGSTVTSLGSAVSATLNLIGKDGAANVQTFGTGTMQTASGAYHINLIPGAGGSMAVGLNSLNASLVWGFSLDLNLPAGASATTTNPNASSGILPASVTLNGSDFAKNDGAGNVVAFTAYGANTATSAGSFNAITDIKSIDTNLTGGQVVQALRFNEAAARTLTIGPGVREGVSGAILVTSTVGSNLAKINGSGILMGSSSGGSEVKVLQNNTASIFEIVSVIGDNAVSGTTSGITGLNKAGPGELLVTNRNTYNGPSYINEGKVIVAGDAAVASVQGGTSTASSAILTGLSNTSALFVGQRVTSAGDALGATTYFFIKSIDSPTQVTLNSNATSGTGDTFTFVASGGLGTSTSGSAVRIANGATLQIGNGGTTGSLAAGQGILNSGTVVFNRSDSGLDFGNSITGVGGVTQAGSGTTTLSGAQNYTGATRVTAGRLIVSGSLLGTSAFTVSSNSSLVVNGSISSTAQGAISGTLGGVGILAGGATLTGGVIAPGTAGSPLTINGMIDLDSTSAFTFTLGATKTSYDSLKSGAITLASGAALQLLDPNAVAGSFAAGDVIQLFSNTGGGVPAFTGSFGTFSLPALGAGLAWDTTNLYSQGELSVMVIPEMSTVTMLLGGAGIFALFRRHRVLS